MTNKRDISIDILKFFAVLLITNSHMDLLYGRFSALATGGAIGDAMFFFCSGYTLFLGRNADFFNWYKRRINRIYPTVFAWALIGCLLLGAHKDLSTILLYGGGWFVSCIMIYYAILWFVRRFALNQMKIVYALTFGAIALWYATIGIDDLTAPNNMYGGGYFKWCFFFLFMLMGATLGRKKNCCEGAPNVSRFERNIIYPLISLLVCTIGFYGLCYFKKFNGIAYDVLQISSLLPLAGICWSFYKICNTKLLAKAYEHRILGKVIRFIGGLCLEIYLVQYAVIIRCNGIPLPLNVGIAVIFIILGAYLLRCLSRIWSQTFKDSDYNIKEIFKPY